MLYEGYRVGRRVDARRRLWWCSWKSAWRGVMGV